MVRAVRDSGPVGAAVTGCGVRSSGIPALGCLDVGEPDAARRSADHATVPWWLDTSTPSTDERAARDVAVGAAEADTAAAPRPTTPPVPAVVPPGLVQPIDAWPGAEMPWLRAAAVGRAAVAGRGAAAGCAVAVGGASAADADAGSTARVPVVASAASVAHRRRRVVMRMSLPRAGDRADARLPACHTPIVTAGARGRGKPAFWCRERRRSGGGERGISRRPSAREHLGEVVGDGAVHLVERARLGLAVRAPAQERDGVPEPRALES